MKTLIVYDVNGRIWTIMSGTYDVPTGLPYLEVEIPLGKRLVSMDTTKTPHEPVFEDLPLAPTDIIKEDLRSLNERMRISDDLNYTTMEAVVSVYEAVFPFLPN